MDRNSRIEMMRCMRFEEGKTLQEIGDAFGGISRERVRQLIGNTGKYAYEFRRRQTEHETDDARAAASL